MLEKRYYICSVIGDGTEDNPLRPKVCDYKIKGFERTAADEADWCLCLVEAEDHTQWINDQDIDEIEEY